MNESDDWQQSCVGSPKRGSDEVDTKGDPLISGSEMPEMFSKRKFARSQPISSAHDYRTQKVIRIGFQASFGSENGHGSKWAFLG